MTSRPPRPALRLAAALAITALAARCDGTPLPEPPDYTPAPAFAAPDPARVNVSVPAVAPAVEGVDKPLIVQLSGGPGAADPGAELWSLVLDDPAQPVRRTQPAADGSFSLGAQEARAGQRIRLVSRGPAGHSPAVDLEVVAIESAPGIGNVVPAAASPLPCLTLRPSDQLSVRDSATLTLQNDCPTALTIDAISLRLNDGFALAEAPSAIDPGASATLTVANDAPLGPSERGDVLLLSVRDGAGTLARYALGVYAPVQ